MRRTFDERAERQDALRGAYDPAALQLKLRDAAQEADVEAEAVAESFMDGEFCCRSSLPVSAFVAFYFCRQHCSVRETK